MKKYILLIFFSAISMLHCMELGNNRLARESSNITESYFKDSKQYENYRDILVQILNIHKWEKVLDPLQKLIGDIQNNKPIFLGAYGLQKRSLPAEHELSLFEPSDGKFMNYLSNFQNLNIKMNETNYQNASEAINNFVITDWSNAVCDLVETNNIDDKSKNEILHYIQHRARFQAGLELDKLAFLYENDFELKRKIFCLLYLEDGKQQLGQLDLHVESALYHFSQQNNKPSFFNHEVIDYAFKRYRNNTLMIFAKYMTNQDSNKISNTIIAENGRKKACAILHAYNALQDIVDYHSDIYHFAAKDAQFLRLLLDYKIKFSNSIVSLAISIGNVDSLRVLKEYGMTFNDTKFIENAIKAENIDCLSFILKQQKNISLEKYQEYIDKVNFKNFIDIDQAAYKALLVTRNDARPLEIIMFDKIELQKICEKILGIHKIYDNLHMVNNIETINKIIATLSTDSFVYLAQKYPNFLNEKLKLQNKRYTEEIYSAINKSFIQKWNKSLYFLGIGPGLFLFSLLLQKDLEATSYFMGLGGMGMVTLCGKNIYAFLKKRYTKYRNLQAKLHVQKNINCYLEGYLYGLQTKDGQITKNGRITNFQKLEQSYEKTITEWHWQKDDFNMLFLNLGFLVFDRSLTVPLLLTAILCIWKSSLQNYFDSVNNSANKLFKNSRKRGKRDGFLKRPPKIEKFSYKDNLFTKILNGIGTFSKFMQNVALQKHYKTDKFLKLKAFKQKFNINHIMDNFESQSIGIRLAE